jgi:quercetin dioxygenase-like cupin family protein
VIDLRRSAAQLRSDERIPPSGHRQIAVHRRGSVTVALFSFEAGSVLKEHRVDGLVSVHVLRGAIEVHTATESHALHGGQLLFLAPGVPHDLHAPMPSDVLVTIHLEREGRAGAEVH